jgi:transcriptional regulator with XRE-family HTH domain
MSDNELGAFLRTRREAIHPAEVGLPKSARRRTPGLRRAELATLAGVSVEYLTRLEQGRDRHPSAQVLVAQATSARGPSRLPARCAPPCGRCSTG